MQIITFPWSISLKILSKRNWDISCFRDPMEVAGNHCSPHPLLTVQTGKSSEGQHWDHQLQQLPLEFIIFVKIGNLLPGLLFLISNNHGQSLNNHNPFGVHGYKLSSLPLARSCAFPIRTSFSCADEEKMNTGTGCLRSTWQWWAKVHNGPPHFLFWALKIAWVSNSISVASLNLNCWLALPVLLFIYLFFPFASPFLVSTLARLSASSENNPFLPLWDKLSSKCQYFLSEVFNFWIFC